MGDSAVSYLGVSRNNQEIAVVGNHFVNNILFEDDSFKIVVPFTVSADAKDGDEIVQLYLGRAEVPGYIQMAEKQLAGYVRLKDLKPGETREAEMQIDPRMLCYWDPAMLLQARPDGARDKWVRARGKRAVYVAASSADIRLTGVIDVD